MAIMQSIITLQPGLMRKLIKNVKKRLKKMKSIKYLIGYIGKLYVFYENQSLYLFLIREKEREVIKYIILLLMI